MLIRLSDIDFSSRQLLIIKRLDGTPVGILGDASHIKLDAKYNDISELSFQVPMRVDGRDSLFYEWIDGQHLIELKGIAQFIIQKPTESGDKVRTMMSVNAYSLEYEFTKKKIAMPESTYKFYDALDPMREDTAMGAIMELMPNWRIGSVDSSMQNKYRTLSPENENLYNFIKDTVQGSYNCIFEFDTLNRTVNVRDATRDAGQKSVFISRDNLAKDISVTELTDDAVTRLDVSGADGVDIRDVNPAGTNQIIDLSYYMTEDNFDSALIAKYNAWVDLVEQNSEAFYNYSVQYSILVGQELAEEAKLADLQGDLTSMENIRAVVIQGIAAGIRTQADLNAANANIAAKEREIEAKQAEINAIKADKDEAMAAMQTIRDACAWDAYFTLDERKQMDFYMFDNEISEPTFVASDTQAYLDGSGLSISSGTFRITDAEVATTQSASGSVFHHMTGGQVSFGTTLSGYVVSGVAEQKPNGKVLCSLYLSSPVYQGETYQSACITLSGTGSASGTDTSVTINVTGSSYLYFTLNASEYEKRSVSWDLYQYGKELLRKLACPSYQFSIDSANFLALDQFMLFKNELELGQAVYTEVKHGKILQPICTGVSVDFDDIKNLSLTFSDTYTANDGPTKLVDLISNSVSLGKTLAAGKYTYASFTDSGASTELRAFIESALDTAKNAIISSSGQAITWDGAGFRLRKYTNSSQTAYDPEQIWMNNNSILMTDDSWATAKMAIGKFVDTNFVSSSNPTGTCWGIVAPMVVGTLLAGERLVIESQKKSGGTAVFRMDEDGCRLYNTDFAISKTAGGVTMQILANPEIGFAIGTAPLVNASTGELNTENAKFYADANGNLTLKGTITSYDGIIGGWAIGNDYIGNSDVSKDNSSVGLAAVSGDNYAFWAGNTKNNISTAAFRVTANGAVYATNLSILGGQISISDAQDSNKVKFSVSNRGILYATGAHIVGKIESGEGSIGGWTIGTNYIGNASTKNQSLVGIAAATGTSVVFWAGNQSNDPTKAAFRVLGNGSVYASNLTITGGKIIVNGVEVGTFSTSGGAKLGGWNVGSTDFTAGAGDSQVGLSSAITANDIAIWAGGVRTKAKFSVTGGGTLSASGANVSGTINASKLTVGNTTITDLGLYVTDTVNGMGFLLKADYQAFLSEYESTIGNIHNKTQYLQSSGLISLSAFSDDVAKGIVTTKAGISLDSNGKITISSLANDAQGAIETAAKITLNSSGEIVLSSSGVSGITTSAFTLNTSGIAFHTNGAFTVTAGNFMVDQSGGVTISKLYVQDSGEQREIDLSGNFSQAVRYDSGSWNGNTFNATVKLFGQVNKVISLGATVTPMYATVTVEDQRGTQCRGTVTLYLTVAGVKGREETVSNLLIDAGSVYTAGANHADSLYTNVGTRELGYMDHGEFISVGSHHWYYK